MKSENSASVKIPMGELDVYIVSDGYFGIGNPQPILAPEIKKETVQHALKGLYLSESDYEIPINTLFIKKGDRCILIDTGEGHHDPVHAGWLQNSLSEIDISTGDITDILITHAHRDHIGGIITQDGARRYPNAQYHLSATEYNFWTSEGKDFSKSKMPSSSYPTGKIQIDTLESIKNDLTLFQPGDTLFSCIKTEAAPGHTPGHIIFHVFSGDQSITHLVDVVHSSLLISHPEWGTQWDVNFEEGVATRNRILEHCHTHNTVVTTCHLPWPGIGYIGKTQNGFQWIPKAQSDPHKIRI
ncbi:MBL fold metallo-hydrolase [Chryseobacterium paridis]|uniref:MBL fold metallo-hydrolase n=1 Tax=Chryseobacterium paridis TaxID=2800328 RepID=A0ABS1FW39_9FLAO|nr:MBL fold metallo-hydrolase [Chryseobacterium paridis]MBK1896563.1 MBL fold metallo-hydrolase [Chryseobacterium paridis]